MNFSDKLKALNDESNFIKEERDGARNSARDLGKKLSSLSQDYSSLREQCRGQLTTIDHLQNKLEETQQTLNTKYTVSKIIHLIIMKFNFDN